MHYYRWSVILTAAGISGGLFLTLLSGLYTVKPFVIDGEVITSGFPLLGWEPGKGLLVIETNWHYSFIWQGFITDFIIYGLLTAATVYLYFIATTAARKQSKATLPSSS